MNEGEMASPELAVFGSEIIDMVNVSMGGIDITDQTLSNRKPLPEDLVKELKKVEASWLKQVGLKEYPRRP